MTETYQADFSLVTPQTSTLELDYLSDVQPLLRHLYYKSCQIEGIHSICIGLSLRSGNLSRSLDMYRYADTVACKPTQMN